MRAADITALEDAGASQRQAEAISRAYHSAAETTDADARRAALENAFES